MKYTIRPFFDQSLFGVRPLLWDDEDWPDLRMNEGLNVYEENNEVVVQAAVPGIPADKIKVTFEEGVLRISGRAEERNPETEKNRGRTVHQWNKMSYFNYTTTLPRPIDIKTMEAEVKDGVITIRSKVSEEAKPREIAVKSADK